MEFMAIFLLFYFALSDSLGLDHFVLDKRPKRCLFEKSYGMNAAVCHGLNLITVPTNLRKNIEILDASYNRIRELYTSSFVNYGYLKILYLEDNMIMYIENGSFTPLQSLEVIDLSSNSLDTVPRELLSLPNLRKLYMNNNRLVAYAGLLNPPSSETLEFLSLSRCHLTQFPPLDSFPSLKTVNFSTNELRSLSTLQLAPMCALQSLDLSNNPLLFKDRRQYNICDCIAVELWIESKQIETNHLKLNCSKSETDMNACANATFSEESTRLYDSCIEVMELKRDIVETRTTWILVAVILTCSLLTVFLVLLWVHKRNKRKEKTDRNKNKKKAMIYENGEASENMVTKYGSDMEI